MKTEKKEDQNQQFQSNIFAQIPSNLDLTSNQTTNQQISHKSPELLQQEFCDLYGIQLPDFIINLHDKQKPFLKNEQEQKKQSFNKQKLSQNVLFDQTFDLQNKTVNQRLEFDLESNLIHFQQDCASSLLTQSKPTYSIKRNLEENSTKQKKCQKYFSNPISHQTSKPKRKQQERPRYVQTIKEKASESSGENVIYEQVGKRERSNSLHQKNGNQQGSLNFVEKTERNKVYSKKYREKKSQKYRQLQQENKFLKRKIDDLTFRNRQIELELSKIKHQSFLQLNQVNNFHKIKEGFLEKIEALLNKQEENITPDELMQLNQEMSSVASFNKDRTDLLNYHIRQLLDNMIPNKFFYWVDCIVRKKGIWVDDISQLTKIDRQVLQLKGIPLQMEQIKKIRVNVPPILGQQIHKFYQLWKSLYESYLKVLNKGIFIESMAKAPAQKRQQVEYIQYQLRAYLYFEKIKYRKDMRLLKQRWYQECSSNIGKASLEQYKYINCTLPFQNENTNKRINQNIQVQQN